MLYSCIRMATVGVKGLYTDVKSCQREELTSQLYTQPWSCCFTEESVELVIWHFVCVTVNIVGFTTSTERRLTAEIPAPTIQQTYRAGLVQTDRTVWEL